ncbi:hypothetical protein [Sphingomonas sp. CFBP 13720]|uniref:hypothetical protein n=1 Tax=Sphingomonas sp. CFBP 13720 TaxID=2775302 RepID=UPI001781C665|nr:hypothetical protein [Sphingomonas sp. CFBP 13720]MBD8679652.1 hypothetical protein [Sphingomonas sp. CFBP 13720]
MLSIRDTPALHRALNTALPPDLRNLLIRRSEQVTGQGDYDFADLAHFIVIEPDDTVPALEREAGVPLTTDPCFEFIERHPGGWLEAVMILSDDGFGLAFFLPDDALDPQLRSLFD